MNQKTAWAVGLGLILGSLLASGCGTCGGPWGSALPPYPSGYGAAVGPSGAMTSAPAPNYGQNSSTTPGWRPATSGTLAPGAAVPATPQITTP